MTFYQVMALCFSVLCAGSAGAINKDSWQPHQCDAFMGAIVIEGLGDPMGSFLSTHSLATSLNHNLPASLKTFFAKDVVGHCDFQCLTDDVEVLLTYFKGQQFHLLSGDYTRRFIEIDPIFGPVTAQLSEQILPSEEAVFYPGDLRLRTQLEVAESTVSNHLKTFLNPRVLQGLAFWLANGESLEESGHFANQDSPQSSARLRELTLKETVPGFAAHLLAHPEKALALLIQNQPEQEFSYALERRKGRIKIWNLETQIELYFKDAGSRFTEMKVMHHGFGGRIQVSVEFQLAHARISQVIENFDHQSFLVEKARAKKIQGIIDPAELAQQASDGTYTQRFSPELDLGEERKYWVFEVGAQARATRYGFKFKMAPRPRPQIITIYGKSYRVLAFENSQIQLNALDGSSSLLGTYLPQEIEHNGRRVQMMSVFLDI